MRFTMSTDEKKSSDVPSFVIAQPETFPEKKSQKRTVIIAVTSVVVAVLVLIAILVGVYISSEAEKEIAKVTMQLKNNMTQDMSSNPNTNVVQFHVRESNQETWTVNDYNSDLKVMKIQTATETNCFVTALNESAPVDVPKMMSGGQGNTGSVAVSFTTTGTPIKDTSFLSKTARDMCSGVSTYWLYPTCGGPVDNNAPNTTLSSNDRHKRETLYYAVCNSYYYVSANSFSYTCTLYAGSYCLANTGSYYCYVFQWFGTYYRGLPMYRCTSYSGGSFYGCGVVGYC